MEVVLIPRILHRLFRGSSLDEAVVKLLAGSYLETIHSKMPFWVCSRFSA